MSSRIDDIFFPSVFFKISSSGGIVLKVGAGGGKGTLWVMLNFVLRRQVCCSKISPRSPQVGKQENHLGAWEGDPGSMAETTEDTVHWDSMGHRALPTQALVLELQGGHRISVVPDSWYLPTGEVIQEEMTLGINGQFANRNQMEHTPQSLLSETHLSLLLFPNSGIYPMYSFVRISYYTWNVTQSR